MMLILMFVKMLNQMVLLMLPQLKVMDILDNRNALQVNLYVVSQVILLVELMLEQLMIVQLMK